MYEVYINHELEPYFEGTYDACMAYVYHSVNPHADCDVVDMTTGEVVFCSDCNR